MHFVRKSLRKELARLTKAHAQSKISYLCIIVWCSLVTVGYRRSLDTEHLKLESHPVKLFKQTQPPYFR